MFYNPNYKSEVMNWGSKDSVDAVAFDDGGGHGCDIRQNQEPADWPWHFDRFLFSDMGVWDQGPILICDSDSLSGYRTISFISDACARRRRHQTVFHDWEYLELENSMLLYGVVLFDWSCSISYKTTISKESGRTSWVLLSVWGPVSQRGTDSRLPPAVGWKTKYHLFFRCCFGRISYYNGGDDVRKHIAMEVAV